MRTLVVGFSHVVALESALGRHPDASIRVVNLRHLSLQQLREENSGWHEPDFVVFSPGGNHHNVLSLFEHDVPYTLGAAAPGDERRLVPQAVFHDVLQAALEPSKIRLKTWARLFEGIPQALLASPAPVVLSDTQWDALIKRRDPTLRRAPETLRVRVYQMQEAVMVEMAKEFCLRYIPSPPETMTADGMLDALYAQGDPTHANGNYGRIILQQLRALQQELETPP